MGIDFSSSDLRNHGKAARMKGVGGQKCERLI